MIMNKIFIEAKDNKTSEYHFIETIIHTFFPDKEFTIIGIDGIGNLFKEAIINQISLAQDTGEQAIVLVDADTISKGYGYAKRKQDIERGMSENNISFPYFIYPNNSEDGDVENLMLKAARRDLHHIFFDCFEDYEKCVSGLKDDNGEPVYNVPDLKGKLHTYMTAQKLPNRLKRKFGNGNWLFNEERYWNLNIAELEPLKDFFASNLK